MSGIITYVGFYNNRRLHSGIDFKTPQKKWNEFEEKEITKFNSSGEAESGSAGEQPARNNPMNEDDLGGAIKPVPSDSKNQSSLFIIPEKNSCDNHQMNSNLFEKSVQFIGG